MKFRLLGFGLEFHQPRENALKNFFSHQINYRDPLKPGISYNIMAFVGISIHISLLILLFFFFHKPLVMFVSCYIGGYFLSLQVIKQSSSSFVS